MIELKPGDYTDMPSDIETRSKIVEAFAAAGASRDHWDVPCEDCRQGPMIGWNKSNGDVMGDIEGVFSRKGGTYYTNDQILATLEIMNFSDNEDYRDGQWHSWTGGECPVNSNDEVEIIDKNGSCVKGEAWQYKAGRLDFWKHEGKNGNIIAFCVVEKAPDKREKLVNYVQTYLHNIGLTGFRYSKQQMDILNALYDAGFLKEPEV